MFFVCYWGCAAATIKTLPLLFFLSLSLSKRCLQGPRDWLLGGPLSASLNAHPIPLAAGALANTAKFVAGPRRGQSFLFSESSLKQVWLGSKNKKGFDLHRSPATYFAFCGETGIRTLDTRRYNGFRDRPDRPLRHLSKSGFQSIFPNFERAKIQRKLKTQNPK